MRKAYNTPDYELLVIADEDVLTASFDVTGEDLDLPEV